VLALGLGGWLVGSAVADVVVVFSQPNVTIAVPSLNGPDGNHGIIVQPFQDSSRTGIRVRQVSFGNPRIASSSLRCDTNPVFNDVVCDGDVDAITITTGDGADEVRFLPFELPAAGAACFSGTRMCPSA
jgi:hypothetical protein